MEAHGGSISAESPVAEGRGTRIILNFPRTESEAPDMTDNSGRDKEEAAR